MLVALLLLVVPVRGEAGAGVQFGHQDRNAPMNAAAMRDELGAALGFEQSPNGSGVWWGECTACGAPKASLGLEGYSCSHCGMARPLEDMMAQRAERRLPPPLDVAGLLQVSEPEEEWLVEGLVPAGGNILLAGYPKTFKTFFLLEQAVALATTTPFLERFSVPTRRRVGVVLMEDEAHRVKRRLRRICLARGVDLATLDGWLYVWSRPPLTLTDQTVAELGEYSAELQLDLLAVDSWAYVASGDSNSADEVTPQLQALSSARGRRKGLSVMLTHHARKERGESADALRLTDIIRNSGAFGAWYDCGIVLGRRDETSPVTVRAELRDYATPDPFAFTIEDEVPGSAETGERSQGWLRLRASDQRPEVVEADARWRRLLPAVLEYIGEHPGCTGRDLRSLTGRERDIKNAADWLAATGQVRYEKPQGKGHAARWYPLEVEGGSEVAPGGSRSQLPPGGSDWLPARPIGRGSRSHPGGREEGVDPETGVGATPRFTCAAGCGAPVGRAGITCASCAAQEEATA